MGFSQAWIPAVCLALLASCRRDVPIVAGADHATLSPQTVAELEARIERDGEAAAEELVRLVVASPAELPDGELDRLGRLLIERSDRERLLERLHALSVARPPSVLLEAWLARLQDYERTILRGVDAQGY